MRGLTPGLANPHPLAALLPALYQDDDFARRFTTGLDDVLAPVIGTLDCLPAYLDPAITPEDFLSWLSGWVGIALDEAWPISRRRELVAQAVELYSWRGTARGLAAHVAVYVGTDPEIVETGGVTVSETCDTPLPQGRPPAVLVRVHKANGAVFDQRRLREIVEAARPAHVACEVEVI